MVADLQLFAVLAQDAALRVLLPAVPDATAVSLTPRELESLRWTMEGKTAWEVGNILGITERPDPCRIRSTPPIWLRVWGWTRRVPACWS